MTEAALQEKKAIFAQISKMKFYSTYNKDNLGLIELISLL